MIRVLPAPILTVNQWQLMLAVKRQCHICMWLRADPANLLHYDMQCLEAGLANLFHFDWRKAAPNKRVCWSLHLSVHACMTQHDQKA